MKQINDTLDDDADDEADDDAAYNKDNEDDSFIWII